MISSKIVKAEIILQYIQEMYDDYCVTYSDHHNPIPNLIESNKQNSEHPNNDKYSPPQQVDSTVRFYLFTNEKQENEDVGNGTTNSQEEALKKLKDKFFDSNSKVKSGPESGTGTNANLLKLFKSEKKHKDLKFEIKEINHTDLTHTIDGFTAFNIFLLPDFTYELLTKVKSFWEKTVYHETSQNVDLPLYIMKVKLGDKDDDQIDEVLALKTLGPHMSLEDGKKTFQFSGDEKPKLINVFTQLKKIEFSADNLISSLENRVETIKYSIETLEQTEINNSECKKRLEADRKALENKVKPKRKTLAEQIKSLRSLLKQESLPETLVKEIYENSDEGIIDEKHHLKHSDAKFLEYGSDYPLSKNFINKTIEIFRENIETKQETNIASAKQEIGSFLTELHYEKQDIPEHLKSEDIEEQTPSENSSPKAPTKDNQRTQELRKELEDLRFGKETAIKLKSAQGLSAMKELVMKVIGMAKSVPLQITGILVVLSPFLIFNYEKLFSSYAKYLGSFISDYFSKFIILVLIISGIIFRKKIIAIVNNCILVFINIYKNGWSSFANDVYSLIKNSSSHFFKLLWSNIFLSILIILLFFYIAIIAIANEIIPNFTWINIGDITPFTSDKNGVTLDGPLAKLFKLDKTISPASALLAVFGTVFAIYFFVVSVLNSVSLKRKLDEKKSRDSVRSLFEKHQKEILEKHVAKNIDDLYSTFEHWFENNLQGKLAELNNKIELFQKQSTACKERIKNLKTQITELESLKKNLQNLQKKAGDASAELSKALSS